MDFIFSFRPQPYLWEYFLRLSVTFISIFLLGIERQISRKPLGLSVFVLSSMSGCVLTIMAILIDPTAPFFLMGNIISGIAFIGAGVLIKSNDYSPREYTTAGLLLAVVTLGLTIGAGFYIMALILYLLIWILLIFNKLAKKKGFGHHGVCLSLNLLIDKYPPGLAPGYEVQSEEQGGIDLEHDDSVLDEMHNQKYGFGYALKQSKRIIQDLKDIGYHAYLDDFEYDKKSTQRILKVRYFIHTTKKKILSYLEVLNDKSRGRPYDVLMLKLE